MAAAGAAEPLTGQPGQPRPAAPYRLIAFAALAAAALGCLVLIGVLLARQGAAADRDALREQILAAARQRAVNFTTLDYRYLDRDLGRVLKGATGKFRKEFAAGTDNLREIVTANQAVSRGEVLEAGIVSSDEDSARVLVVADSTVTNTASTQPEKRHYRLQLDLVRRDGTWLVSDLEFVG